MLVNHIPTPVSAPTTKLTSTSTLKYPSRKRRAPGTLPAAGEALEVRHQDAPADGELGEEDVENVEAADDQALHDRPEIVEGIIGEAWGRGVHAPQL